MRITTSQNLNMQETLTRSFEPQGSKGYTSHKPILIAFIKNCPTWSPSPYLGVNSTDSTLTREFSILFFS